MPLWPSAPSLTSLPTCRASPQYGGDGGSIALDPKVAPRDPQLCWGGGETVLQMILGRDRASAVALWPPTHPSYGVLVHGGGVWAMSPPPWLRVPFPGDQGDAPVNPSYLQAQYGGDEEAVLLR